MANISINELSQTISELVELDADQQSLLESAMDRAISTKDIVGGIGIGPVVGPTIGVVIAGGFFPIGKIKPPIGKISPAPTC